MSIWEEIYSRNEQLNKYPFDSVVSFIFKNFGKLSYEERKNIKILEVGCGACNNIWFLSEEGFDTYGIDISKSAINFGKKVLEKKNLNANLMVGSFTELPYEDNYFDIIIDRLAITQCPTFIEDSLLNVKRVLKDEGLFFSIMFNTEHSGYKESIGKQESINNYGFMKVNDDYLSNLGQTYFIDNENTIIKKYFKIINLTKVSHEFDNKIHSQTIFILNK